MCACGSSHLLTAVTVRCTRQQVPGNAGCTSAGALPMAGVCSMHGYKILLRGGGCCGWMLTSMPVAALCFGREITGASCTTGMQQRAAVRVPPPCAGHVDGGARVEGDAGRGRVCANAAARPHAVPRRLCQHLLLQDVWLPDRPRRPPGALLPLFTTAACCKSSIPTARFVRGERSEPSVFCFFKKHRQTDRSVEPWFPHAPGRSVEPWFPHVPTWSPMLLQ